MAPAASPGIRMHQHASVDTLWVMTPVRTALAGGAVAVLLSCSGDVGRLPRYHGSFIVLESAAHGPELCSSVRESLPPQCGGIPVIPWDWSVVDGAQTLQGTTWGSWHVTGTFDGAVFTLTERPGPVQPHGKGQDRSGGVAAPGRAGIDSRLPAVQEDLASSEVRETLGAVQYSYTDRAGERLLVGLWLADKAAHRFAEERWGDLVELRSLLEPVE